jgi:hypothetical protein
MAELLGNGNNTMGTLYIHVDLDIQKFDVYVYIQFPMVLLLCTVIMPSWGPTYTHNNRKVKNQQHSDSEERSQHRVTAHHKYHYYTGTTNNTYKYTDM